MKRAKFSAIGLGACLVLSASAFSAFADGMPYGAVKPQPNLTPLDQALDQIQNQEPPISVVAPPAEEPAPAIVAAPAPAPVPETRVVEVQENTSFFGLSVGMYDPFSHGEQAASFNLEWQPGVKIAGVLQPLFGAMATTEGSLLGYGGIGIPFHLGERIFVMPSVAVGAYKEGGGYDLDRTLAFRAGTELAYEFDDKSRLGINAHILTNGRSLDREDRTEIISLVYTTPTNILSGGRSSTAMPATIAPAVQPAPDASAAPPDTLVAPTAFPENQDDLNN